MGKGWEREPGSGHAYVAENSKRNFEAETGQPRRCRAVRGGLLKERIPFLGRSGVPKGIVRGEAPIEF